MSIPVLYLNQTGRLSGAEKSLLALWRKLNKEFIPYLILPESGPLKDQAEKAGVEVIILPELPQFGEPNQIKKMAGILTGALKIKKIIHQKGIKLVHANSPRMGYIAGLAAKLASVQAIIHVRDIHLSPFASYWKALIFDLIANKIIAVSEATRNSIIVRRQKLSPKTKVIYNGLDLEEIDKIKAKTLNFELKDEERASGPFIGVVGLLHPVKGIDILIKATPKILKSFPTAKILILGDVMRPEEKNYVHQLKMLSAELSLQDKVLFLGYQEEPIAWIKSLDLLVHPALYPEPLPRAVLEAAACEKPVVASKTGGLPEIIMDGWSGLLVPPGDAEALAEACLSLLKNRDLAQQIGQRARQIIKEKFSLEKHCQQVEALYQELLEASQ